MRKIILCTTFFISLICYSQKKKSETKIEGSIIEEIENTRSISGSLNWANISASKNNYCYGMGGFFKLMNIVDKFSIMGNFNNTIYQIDPNYDKDAYVTDESLALGGIDYLNLNIGYTFKESLNTAKIKKYIYSYTSSQRSTGNYTSSVTVSAKSELKTKVILSNMIKIGLVNQINTLSGLISTVDAKDSYYNFLYKMNSLSLGYQFTKSLRTKFQTDEYGMIFWHSDITNFVDLLIPLSPNFPTVINENKKISYIKILTEERQNEIRNNFKYLPIGFRVARYNFSVLTKSHSAANTKKEQRHSNKKNPRRFYAGIECGISPGYYQSTSGNSALNLAYGKLTFGVGFFQNFK